MVNTIFDIGENRLKFPAGPTSPKPGPILFNVAATAVKFVSKSKLSIEIIIS